MEINKLKTFVDLAKTLSFSETAENLYTSQSTISKQIKSLEKELGQPLFIRTNKKVELSDFGKAILENAAKIVELEQAISNQAQKFAVQNKNQIHIGVIPTFSNYEIFQKTMDYQKLHPKLSIVLHELETNVLVQKLMQNKIDIAFTRSMNIHELGFNQIPIAQEKFKVCLYKGHSLAKEKIIHLQDLKSEKFIMLAKNSLLYQPVIDLCHEAGFEPNVSFVGDRMSSILRMVNNQQGISILMHPKVADHSVIFKELTPTKTSDLLFIKKKDNNSKLVLDFWQYLQQFAMPKRNN